MSNDEALMRTVYSKPKREKPPVQFPAADVFSEMSGFDGVGPLVVLALGGRDRQAHFLPDGSGQEPANGMWLPGCGFHQLLGGNAARPLQQFEHLGGLAAVAGARRFLRALGRFPGLAFFADFAFFGATWARRAPAVAFLVAFGSSAEAAGTAPASGVDVMVFSPLVVISAVTTSITPVRRESKRILQEMAYGDGMAMATLAARSWHHLASDGSPRLNSRTQTGGSYCRAAQPAQR
jgi:hypothetical protein